MDPIIENFFNLEVLKANYPFLLRGLFMTLKLSVVVVPLGLLAGLLLAALHSAGFRVLNAILIVYVDCFRSLPPLVLLIFVYYGLPMAGFEVSNFTAVVLAFLLNTSSYYGEILRAGIESIERGQWDAARSSGLSRAQTLWYVILPQAARNVMPDLISNTLEVIKLTSLASVVALPELLRMARVAQGLTYNPTPLIMAAVMYFLLLWPLVRFLSRLERQAPASR